MVLRAFDTQAWRIFDAFDGEHRVITNESVPFLAVDSNVIKPSLEECFD